MYDLMCDASNWENSDQRKALLATCLKKGRLALIYGAGISMSLGLPSWKTLVTRLYNAIGSTFPDHIPLITATTLLRHDHYRGKAEEFPHLVQQCLYDGFCSIEQPLYKNWLAAMESLVTQSTRGRVSRIVTFNFDDLFERHLREKGIVVRSWFDLPEWDGNEDVRILHPHGFLPLDAHNEARSSSVVLTDSDFDLYPHRELGRQWEDVILGIFRSHVCLFVGVSGDDPNLCRWMSRANTHHARNKNGAPNWPFWAVRLTNGDPDPEKDIPWRSRGVASIPLGSFEAAIAEIREIGKMAAKM